MASGAARPERAVLDTNVLASALVFGGLPLRVLELGQAGLFRVASSAFILRELSEVLASRKFGWDARRIREAVAELSSAMLVVEPSMRVDAIRSQDSDNRILECALEARAGVIVTGNMKHIRPLGEFRGIRIMTPREFLERYFPGEA